MVIQPIGPGSRERRIVLRADASARAGLGHVMRCLTLGEVLVGQGWDVRLATTSLPDHVRDTVVGLGITVVPVDATPGRAGDAAELAEHLGTSSDDPHQRVVLIDGYQFDHEFFDTLVDRRPLAPLVIVDDGGLTAASTPDLVIDQNPSATRAQYERFGERTTLLLGLDYALIRRSLRDRARVDRAHASDSVVVSMGGSDPLGLSLPVAEALADRALATKVVIGPATSDAAELAARLDAMPFVDRRASDTFETDLANAAVAVIGAGTTMWEAAFLGTPAVAVAVADNQADPAEAAEREGFLTMIDARAPEHQPGLAAAIADTTATLLADPERRASFTRHGRAAVDGSGAERVASALTLLTATKAS